MLKTSKFCFFLCFYLIWCSAIAAQDPGDAFFSQWAVHEIRFQFHQQGYFDSLTANYSLDKYMEADVTIDGQFYPRSGVKYKGNSSYNNPSQKKPFRIDLEEYVDEQTHDGLKKLVLNNGFKDPSFLREKLMLDFLNANGIAAPRCAFARLYVNEQYRGLYTVIEDVNKTFLKDRFGNNDGNLFKGDNKGSLVWKGEAQNLYYGDYELKTNETENNWSDLIAFIKSLNQTPSAQLQDSLAAHLNVESWLNYWAAHNIFVNLDSYIGSGHNYFIYHNEENDRFEWISWDVNEAFGNFQMGIPLASLKLLPFGHIPMPAAQRPLMSRPWTENSYRQALAAHVCTLLEHFNNAEMDPRIDALADLIRPAVYADNLKFFTNQQFEQNLSQDLQVNGGPGLSAIAGLKPFITARRAALIQQLSAYGCTVSETEEIREPNVKVSPNPFDDWLMLETEAGEILRYQLRDVLGTVRLEGECEGKKQVETKGLGPGVYMLVFMGQKGGQKSVPLLKN